MTEAPEEEWFDRCTCPGSERLRARQRERTKWLAAEDERRREVMGNIDLGRGRPPEEIRAMIVAAYAEHGWEPPTDFTWISRYLSAGTARHVRPLRLAIELGKSVQGAVRTLREENRRMGGDR